VGEVAPAEDKSEEGAVKGDGPGEVDAEAVGIAGILAA